MDQAASGRAPYGVELILDLHDCDPSTFNRKSIAEYFEKLCDLIDMEAHDLHFWDYEDMDMTEEEWDALPVHVKGTSAIQFIMTSNITIHTLDDLKKVFINIFSCKYFDSDIARTFTEKAFSGYTVNNDGKGVTIDRL